FADVLSERGHHSRRVLPWKLDEHRKAAVAFDERRDVRVACSGKKISFPMARNGAILGLGGSPADRDHIEYVPLSILGLAAFGVTHLPPCTQLCRQLLLQHAARLNKEAAIDRFVRYPHVSVGRKLLLPPPGDLPSRPLTPKLLPPAPSKPPMERKAKRLGAQRPPPAAPPAPFCTESLRPAVASNLPAYRRWRSFETSCDPTDRP